MMANPYAILGALAGVAVVGALIAASGGKDEKDPDELLDEIERIRENVLAQFKVDPGCERIEFIGSPDAARDFWAGPGNEYVSVAIGLATKAELKTASEVTQYAATDLFPQCQWPPPAGPLTRPDQKLVWYALREAIEGRMG